MRDAQSGWDRDKGGERGFKAFSTGGDKFISPEEKWKWHNMVNLSFICLSPPVSLDSCKHVSIFHDAPTPTKYLSFASFFY